MPRHLHRSAGKESGRQILEPCSARAQAAPFWQAARDHVRPVRPLEVIPPKFETSPAEVQAAPETTPGLPLPPLQSMAEHTGLDHARSSSPESRQADFRTEAMVMTSPSPAGDGDGGGNRGTRSCLRLAGGTEGGIDRLGAQRGPSAAASESLPALQRGTLYDRRARPVPVCPSLSETSQQTSRVSNGTATTQRSRDVASAGSGNGASGDNVGVAAKQQRPLSVPANFCMHPSSASHLDWLTSLVRSVWRGVDCSMHPRAKLRAAMEQLSRLAEWYMSVLPEALTYVSPAVAQPEFPELPQLPRFHRGIRKSRKRDAPRSPRPLTGSQPLASRASATRTPLPESQQTQAHRPMTAESHRKLRRSARRRCGRHPAGGPRYFLIQRHLVAMQERRERLRQKAFFMSKPRRAASALPVLDAQWIELDFEDKEGQLLSAVEEFPTLAEWEVGTSHPVASLESPQETTVATCSSKTLRFLSDSDVGHMTEASLKYSSSIVSASSPTASSSSPFPPSHCPPLRRFHSRRINETKTKAEDATNATVGFKTQLLPAAFLLDLQSSGTQATVPQLKLQFCPGRYVSKVEKDDGDLVASFDYHGDEAGLKDTQATNNVEAALNALGTVLVLNSVTSGTGNESSAPAHLLINSSQQPALFSGVLLQKSVSTSNFQAFDYVPANGLSTNFASENVLSSATTSDKTDTPITSVATDSPNLEPFKTPTVVVDSEQYDIIRTSAEAFPMCCESDNTYITTMFPSLYQEECHNNHERKSTKIHPSTDTNTNVTKYPNMKCFNPTSCQYRHKSERKKSRESCIGENEARITSIERTSNKKDLTEPIILESSTETEKKRNEGSISSDHTSTHITDISVQEVCSVKSPKGKIKTQSLKLQPTHEEELSLDPPDRPEVRGANSICQRNASFPPEEFSLRLCERVRLNLPVSSNFQLVDASAISRTPVSQLMLSIPSSPLDAHTPTIMHSSRKPFIGNPKSSTSTMSCNIRRPKLRMSRARRRGLSYTLPEIPSFGSVSHSKKINRSSRDEKKTKHRRSHREITCLCDADKVAGFTNFISAIEEASSVKNKEKLEILRHFRKALAISPPIPLAIPDTNTMLGPSHKTHGAVSPACVSTHSPVYGVESKANVDTPMKLGTNAKSEKDVNTPHLLLTNYKCVGADPGLSKMQKSSQLEHVQQFLDPTASSPISHGSSLQSSPYVSAKQTPDCSPPHSASSCKSPCQSTTSLCRNPCQSAIDSTRQFSSLCHSQLQYPRQLSTQSPREFLSPAVTMLMSANQLVPDVSASIIADERADSIVSSLDVGSNEIGDYAQDSHNSYTARHEPIATSVCGHEVSDSISSTTLECKTFQHTSDLASDSKTSELVSAEDCEIFQPMKNSTSNCRVRERSNELASHTEITETMFKPAYTSSVSESVSMLTSYTSPSQMTVEQVPVLSTSYSAPVYAKHSVFPEATLPSEFKTSKSVSVSVIPKSMAIPASDSKVSEPKVEPLSPLNQSRSTFVPPASDITRPVCGSGSEIQELSNGGKTDTNTCKSKSVFLSASETSIFSSSDSITSLLSDATRLLESDFKMVEHVVEFTSCTSMPNPRNTHAAGSKPLERETVHDSSITCPQLSTSAPTEKPKSASTYDSESCGDYSDLMRSLSRHEELLRGVAARRGVECKLPLSRKHVDPCTMTHKEYLCSLRQHLELVRILCPSEPPGPITGSLCKV